ncbi:transcriptional regulator [Escherichia coli]|nr:transcriptional regulator [Escherichia coli]
MFFTAMKNILSKGNVVHIQNEEEIDVNVASECLRHY